MVDDSGAPITGMTSHLCADVGTWESAAAADIIGGGSTDETYDAVTSNEETMYAYATLGETKKRDLNAGDIAGINGLYRSGQGRRLYGSRRPARRG